MIANYCNSIHNWKCRLQFCPASQCTKKVSMFFCLPSQVAVLRWANIRGIYALPMSIIHLIRALTIAASLHANGSSRRTENLLHSKRYQELQMPSILQAERMINMRSVIFVFIFYLKAFEQLTLVEEPSMVSTHAGMVKHICVAGLGHHWFRLLPINWTSHYTDVRMSPMAPQITSLTIVYSTVYSGAYQGEHQSSAALAFVRGIHRWPVNSLHKGPVTRKMFPFDDVIRELTYRYLDSK